MASLASICELSIAGYCHPIPYTAGLYGLDYVYWMRKFGLIAAIVGFVILAAGLLLRVLANHPNLPGYGCPVPAARRRQRPFPLGTLGEDRRSLPMPKRPQPSDDTARLLDNFEQRFAELKGRKPNATVLGDLYTLGNQLEQRGRTPQATAVYRHLARFDNTYRDVAARLRRLMDAERAKPKAATTANAVSPPLPPTATTPNLRAAAQRRHAAAAAAAAAAVPDTERLGRYLLEREIGRGAMGVVFLGRDTAINRMVAIKAIPLASEFSDAELAEARSRFFREAETAGRLNHPNIVTIYDVGEERGLAYIAMEYLKGRHLSDYSRSNNLLEPRKVLDHCQPHRGGLGIRAQAAGGPPRHQARKSHVRRRAPTRLKITDFGIARLSGAGSTRTGIVLGTPSFMSPEQLEGRTVTGHSDLFSLGVSLFQLLTGQLPFTADSMTGLMQQIAEAPHPPLRAFRPDLPACVESVIDRALAKNPEDTV